MAKDLFAGKDEIKPILRTRKFHQLEKEQEEEGSSNNLTMISLDKFIEDPDNASLFGEITMPSILDLTHEIEREGFRGAIMAYPVVTADGEQKYEIESGHRRVEAAKSAGIKEIPVIITEPPLSDEERRLRVIGMNLNDRAELTPCQISRLISTQMKDYATLREKKGESVDKTTIYTLVSQRMNMSEANLRRYLSLQKIIPELQDLADAGVPWSALIQAAMLPEERQKMIALIISKEVEENGAGNISKAWVLSLISHNKNEVDGVTANGASFKQKTVARRRSGMKIISTCIKNFEDVFNGNAKLNNSEKKQAYDDLVLLREKINKKINELGEDIVSADMKN